MKNRFFTKKLLNQSTKQLTEGDAPLYYDCLNSDVITKRVSDHHPTIHHHGQVLFWNVMMPAKKRNGHYNNGFGFEETEKDYIKRLKKIALVIGEITYRYPDIEIISLCEGPVQQSHVHTLLHSLKKIPSMERFFMHSIITDQFHQTEINEFPQWGLLMLAHKKYQVKKIQCDFIHPFIFSRP